MEFTPTTINKGKQVIADVSKVIKDTSKRVSENSTTEISDETLKTVSDASRAYTIGFIKNINSLSKDVKSVNEKTLSNIFRVENNAELPKLFSSIYGDAAELEKSLFEHINSLKISGQEIEDYITSRCLDEPLEVAIKGVKDKTEFKSELLRDLIADVQDYGIIKNNPIFAPYNLSLKETAEVGDILKSSRFGMEKIYDFLRTKDEKLFNLLDAENAFKEINGKNPANRILTLLQERLYGSASVENFIHYSSAIKHPNIDINGRKVNFMFIGKLPKGNLSVPKITKNEIATLIESNMLTLDCLRDPIFIKEIKSNPSIIKYIDNTAKVTYQNPSGKIVKNKEFDFNKVLEKIDLNGLESLSSNEIHAVTDILSNIFEGLTPAAKSSFVSRMEPKAQKMYSLVQDMKSTLVSSGDAKIDSATGYMVVDGVKFKDHYIMRMIDRDLANVVDFNNDGKIVSFSELTKKVAEKVNKIPQERTGNFDKDKCKLSDLHTHGLKILGGFENGQRVVDSIMQ